jgi:carbamoyltransferase
MAGGVALNCVANSRIWRDGPFEHVWVQPAAGDSGTALGAALHVSRALGDDVRPMPTAALGRSWDDEALAAWLTRAGIEFERPDDLAEAVAHELAQDGIVAWFQGRSEFGPRALGHRSLLADPRNPANLERLNDVKGREQFRPVAPMVLEEHARSIFTGRHPSPHMLFVHDVAAAWRTRIPAVVHVDGTARPQTVSNRTNPRYWRLIREFEALTGVPALLNTSFNVQEPIVCTPTDAVRTFSRATFDALVLEDNLTVR